MGKVVNFCIIGTSGIAAVHARCISRNSEAKLVAMVASTAVRADAAEKQYGVAAYDSIDEALQHHDIHACVICTASGQHLEPTLSLLRRGVHVLCEKPLEINVDRASQMIRAADAAGCLLGGVFQNRFSPDFLKLQEAVKANQFGSLLLANAYIKWYRNEDYYATSPWKGTLKGDGGAALINQGIHTIDLLLLLAGEVKSVFAKVKTVMHAIEGEDLGVCILTFKNGMTGVIEGSTALYPGYPERIEVYGTDGSAILEGGRIIEWNFKQSEAMALEVKDGVEGSGASDPMAISDDGHQRQIDDFVAALKEGRLPAVSHISALNALNLIQHIYLSAEQKREVEVKPVQL